MDSNNRSNAIAAAVILVGFGLFAYFMPTIMLDIGSVSPIAAGAVVVLFVVAFFVVFWLRARSQKKRSR